MAYIFHREILKSNIRKIRKSFKDHDVNLMLCYSCKTNLMHEVIDVIKEEGVVPEIVSEHEHDAVGMTYSVCNGVAMTYDELTWHIDNRDLVVFNDVESIKMVHNERYADVGLRVRFDDASRFGVHVNDLPYALKVLNDTGFRLVCLHCHVTGTRKLTLYRQKVKNMIDVIVKNRIKPKFIDFGGSMYGIMSEELSSQFDDVGCFDDYARIISEEISRLDYKPVVMLELGTALISNCVTVKGNVVRCDEYGRVVLDIDKFSIGMMMNKKLSFKHNACRSSSDESKKYTVYGCTCIEDDVLIDEYYGHVEVGDSFEFMNCGAYSYCFEPEFIIPRQEVIVV